MRELYHEEADSDIMWQQIKHRARTQPNSNALKLPELTPGTHVDDNIKHINSLENAVEEVCVALATQYFIPKELAMPAIKYLRKKTNTQQTWYFCRNQRIVYENKDVCKSYYCDVLGVSNIYFDVEIGDTIHDTSSVVFGTDLDEVPATIKSKIAKCRRLATLANKSAQEIATAFYKTNRGIHYNAQREVFNSLIDIDALLKAAGYSRIAVSKCNNTDFIVTYKGAEHKSEIVCIEYSDRTRTIHSFVPAFIEYTVFASDASIRHSLNVLADVAYNRIADHAEQVEFYEQQKIVDRLVGEPT